MQLKAFANANDVKDVVELYSRYRVRCTDFILGCTNFSTPSPWDCCQGAEPILDIEYGGCYRLSNLGEQTWLGSRAGLSIIFKTSFPEVRMKFCQTLQLFTSFRQKEHLLDSRTASLCKLFPVICRLISTRSQFLAKWLGLQINLSYVHLPMKKDLIQVAEISLEWEETQMMGLGESPCKELPHDVSPKELEELTESACFIHLWHQEFVTVTSFLCLLVYLLLIMSFRPAAATHSPCHRFPAFPIAKSSISCDASFSTAPTIGVL